MDEPLQLSALTVRATAMHSRAKHDSELGLLPRAYAPAGFFLVRSPLFPLQRVVAWGANLDPPVQGWAARSTALAERLLAAFREPALRQALFFASSQLALLVDTSDTEGGLSPKLSRTLTRYFMRAAGRETPFGSFAGVSFGRITATNCLQIAPLSAYRSKTSVAGSHLYQIMLEHLSRPGVRDTVVLEPNSTLALVQGNYRFATGRLSADGSQRVARVELGHAISLERALAFARTGVTAHGLAEALARLGLTYDETLAFARTLCDRGVLVPSWSPSATGTDHLSTILDQLAEHAPSTVTRDSLSQIQRDLSRADAAPLGSDGNTYRAVSDTLRDLAVPPGKREPLHSVLVKPAPQLEMSTDMSAQFLAAAEIVQRTGWPPELPELEDFKRRFKSRYDARLVPLAEAVDHELGVGFGTPEAHRADALLTAIPVAPTSSAPYAFNAYDVARQQLLQRTLEGGHKVCHLDEEALLLFPPTPAKTLPESFTVTARVARGASSELLVVSPAVASPSAAITLGRFCNAEPQLFDAVQRLVKREQQLAGDSLLADVAYFPCDQSANVVLRPALRAYEIPYFGKSGAPLERQIPISDLYVSIENERVVLYSKLHQKRIQIRITNALNFRRDSHLSIFRFLGALQSQDQGGLVSHWTWDALFGSAFLPRVVHGSSVLGLCTWRLSSRELKPILGETGARAFALFQQLREQRKLPRWLTRSDRDECMPIDLDNELSVADLLHEAQKRSNLVLEELFPGPEDLVLESPEGKFAGEFVVPFVRERGAKPVPSAAPKVAEGVRAERKHAPGSDWLYVKIYASRSHLDDILLRIRVRTVEPLLNSVVLRWFYLPFADPEPHLRVRFNGPAAELLNTALPSLHAALSTLLASGVVWRLQIDTYEQEIERYGGSLGVALAEDVFWADSEAACQLLTSSEPDSDLRWQLALLGIHRLLQDCGFDLAQQLAFVLNARDRYGDELGAGTETWKATGTAYKHHQQRLSQLLWQGETASQGIPRAVAEALDRRSSRIAPLLLEFQRGSLVGEIDTEPVELALAFAHLHATRVLGVTARAHELLLYDFLRRQYASRLARSGELHGA